MLRIQPDEDGASLALSASWSSLLPPRRELVDRGPVLLRAEYRRDLQRVYQELLPLSQFNQTTLFVGHVDTLNGNRDANGAMCGEIVVSLLDDEIKAHLELDAADYASALDAHARYTVVKFRGQLVRGTRKHHVRDVSDFELVE